MTSMDAMFFLPFLTFELQLALWGYDIRGSEGWEFAANISENHPTTVANTHRNASDAWDRDARYCESIRVHPPRPTYRYALAGLAGYLMHEQGVSV